MRQLAIMNKQDSKRRIMQGVVTNTKSANKIAKLAPPQQRKIIAESAMLDMSALVEGLKCNTELTPHQRFVANTIMYGILSYCNHLGWGNGGVVDWGY